MGSPFTIAHFMAGINTENNDLCLTNLPKCDYFDTSWESFKELL